MELNSSTLGDITQIITAITAFGAMLLAWRTSFKITKVGEKVEAVHLATNSLQDKLVEATAIAAHAEGVVVGRLEEKNENR
jgi:hypothetical protein